MPEPTRPGNHQARQHGPELLDDRSADQPADHGAGAELVEGEARLEREHHAGEHARQQHDGQRADADRIELLDDVTKIERARDQRAEELPHHEDVLLDFQERRLQPFFET